MVNWILAATFKLAHYRNLHKFFGLFPTVLLDRETEEMIHDEGLLARFWGAWFDACVMCFNTMVGEAMNGNPFTAPAPPSRR